MASQFPTSVCFSPVAPSARHQAQHADAALPRALPLQVRPAGLLRDLRAGGQWRVSPKAGAAHAGDGLGSSGVVEQGGVRGLGQVARGGTLVSPERATPPLICFPVFTPSAPGGRVCVCGWGAGRRGAALSSHISLPVTSLQWWTTVAGCHAWGPSCFTRCEALAAPTGLERPPHTPGTPGHLTVSSLLVPRRASRGG